MQLYKIQQLIELLGEYNTYFFAGKDEPINDLIDDAQEHQRGILNTYIDENVEKNVITVDKFRDFIGGELFN